MTDFSYNEPEAGNYPAQFSNIEDFEYDDATTKAKEYRWRWIFHLDDGNELDTLTSRSWKSGTTAFKFLSGILGRAPIKGDNIADHIGKRVRVTYGPNRAGRLTITDVQIDRDAKPEPTPA